MEGAIPPLHLSKGYDLRLSGRPLPELEDLPPPRHVAAVAGRLRFVKPRLAVNVGNRVKVGSLLFSDKSRPEVQFRSPGGGTTPEAVALLALFGGGYGDGRHGLLFDFALTSPGTRWSRRLTRRRLAPRVHLELCQPPIQSPAFKRPLP